MSYRACLCLAVLTGLLACAREAECSSAAADYLREAEVVCRADDGALWGVSLCGPVLLVDPATRAVFANQPDRENQLHAEAGVFTGKLPENINIANTAADWAGVKWTMIMLPLPEERDRRAALFAHEMWHRIQDRLALSASAATNNHLDTRDGRFWLQLEWRALAGALSFSGAEQQNAITDAGLFRARRRKIFPNAPEEESAMELSEGLAEYTGVKLSGSRDLPGFVIEEELKSAPAKPTFVRSFAYATGPAYGLLLDQSLGDRWRTKLRPGDDLATLLLDARRITLPADLESAAQERARNYGSAELALAEDARERKRLDLEQSYRARFVEGSVLTIPLQKMNMQFNPGNLVPLGDRGTVYPTIRIVDVWGVLDVTENGALLSSDFTRVSVPAPQPGRKRATEGDGWKLELTAGWSVTPDQRSGDYVVTHRE